MFLCPSAYAIAPPIMSPPRGDRDQPVGFVAAVVDRLGEVAHRAAEPFVGEDFVLDDVDDLGHDRTITGLPTDRGATPGTLPG